MGLLSAGIGEAESTLLFGILFGIWVRGTWEMYLLFRQWTVVRNTTVIPEVLARILPIDLFFIARLYYLDVILYLIVYIFLDIVAKSMVLLFDVIFVLWTLSIGVAKAFGSRADRETLITIIFVLIVHTAESLYTVVFKIYYQFTFENRIKSNRKLFVTFLVMSIITYLLKAVGILIYVPALLFLVQLTGSYFFLVLWLVRLIFIFIVTFIFMDVILPKMSQIEPLEDGELKNALQQIASRVNFPLTRIYVYRASETSTEKNAFFYGFYKGKRIVLYDTLIALLSVQEIVGVVAHELGHWKGNHTIKIRILVEIYYILIFTAAYLLFPLDIIYKAFNFRESKPIIVGLMIVFDFIFIPWDYVFSSVSTLVTRRFEYEADAFAVTLGQGKFLRSALMHLNKYNPDFPVNDWLFSMFNYSHPTLLERLARLPENL